MSGQSTPKEAQLKHTPVLWNFMDKHCHMTKYVFQVKKCSDDLRIYCIEHQIWMPAGVFDSLSFLPLPWLDTTNEYYCPFSELFSEEPSDFDRPSRVPDEEGEEADKTNSELFCKTHNRKVISCQYCLKPWCVFAAKVLATEEKAIIALVDESRFSHVRCQYFLLTLQYTKRLLYDRNLSAQVQLKHSITLLSWSSYQLFATGVVVVKRC